MKKFIIILIIIFTVLIVTSCILLYKINIIPHKYYSNEDFNIETYISNIDKDDDGIDDQTDILNNVKKYISTKPKYESKYYSTGYPNDEYGVCTDVVAFGLKDAGYDLMELVNEDIINNEEKNTNHAIINIYLPTALLIGFVIKFATELFGERRNNYEYGMVFNFYCYWTNYLDRNWSRNERRHL